MLMRNLLQKTKKSGNFEFSLYNNFGFLIFHTREFSTQLVAYRTYFCLVVAKSDIALFSESEDLKGKNGSFARESRIRREVKMPVKYRRRARIVVGRRNPNH